MFIGTNEPIKELVNRELQMFKRYWVDAKDIKCPLEWWGKHEFLFSNTITTFVHQIFGIMGSKIKTKKIFLLVGILRRFFLQLNNLDKLIFVNENWPNDLKVGYSSLFNLIKLIESIDVLDEEYEKYEGKFEKYENLDL